MCCNHVGKHTDPSIVKGLGQLGIVNLDLFGLIGDVGVDCIIDAGCKQQAVCCTKVVTGATIADVACSGISL
ncbi:hypothetical protein HGRIS_014581 [Hohenbuehelia grisea]|uniref:Hydrophobin n=1 Tax=Hohenbuehelia grisea TaxID=104357 RepID=A0ABR3JUI9_9AGAR